MAGRAIILHDIDNVATAITDLEPGEAVDTGKGILSVTERVPFGHKLALKSIARGATIIKYGESVGLATQEIPAGGWVHVHNVESQRGRGDLRSNRS